MTSTPTDTRTSVTHAMLIAALTALRHMMISGHVEIRDLWNDFGSGPGAVAGRAVAVDTAGHPAAREALLAGMTEVVGPYEWKGSHNSYRDWRGYLMLMPILVTERIDRPDPAPAAAFACADHPDFVPDSLFHLRQHIEEEHAEEIAEADTWGPALADSLAGIAPPYIADADPRPLLDLVLDERFGPARGPVAPIEIIGEPGQSVENLAARFGNIQGLVVIPGDPVDDGSVEAAYSRYARARALHWFGDKHYPTIIDAREAVKYWAGCDMLTDRDRELVATALVDPTLIPEPPRIETGTDRRRFLLLPGLRRRRAADASEVAF